MHKRGLMLVELVLGVALLGILSVFVSSHLGDTGSSEERTRTSLRTTVTGQNALEFLLATTTPDAALKKLMGGTLPTDWTKIPSDNLINSGTGSFDVRIRVTPPASGNSTTTVEISGPDGQTATWTYATKTEALNSGANQFLYDPSGIGGGASSLITAVSAPTLVTTNSFTWGAWMVDPKAPSGKAWIFPGYYNATSLTQYPSIGDLKANTNSTMISLGYGWDGTGHTIHDGILYYNEGNSNRMIRFNIAAGLVTHRVELPGAVYRNSASYQWGGFSDIDFAYDETGLYVIYATKKNGNIIISKLDPDNLNILTTWTTTRSHNCGNSFMARGVLYVIANYHGANTTIDYIYETQKSSGKTSAISFRNDFRYNSMIDYNYGDNKLYSWDNGNLVSYTLTF